MKLQRPFKPICAAIITQSCCMCARELNACAPLNHVDFTWDPSNLMIHLNLACTHRDYAGIFPSRMHAWNNFRRRTTLYALKSGPQESAQSLYNSKQYLKREERKTDKQICSAQFGKSTGPFVLTSFRNKKKC